MDAGSSLPEPWCSLTILHSPTKSSSNLSDLLVKPRASSGAKLLGLRLHGESTRRRPERGPPRVLISPLCQMQVLLPALAAEGRLWVSRCWKSSPQWLLGLILLQERQVLTPRQRGPDDIGAKRPEWVRSRPKGWAVPGTRHTFPRWTPPRRPV